MRAGRNYISYMKFRRYLSLPPRFMAREGGQTARVELEPTNSTLVAAFFVLPLLTIFGIFSDFGLHATGRRERRVRHGSR